MPEPMDHGPWHVLLNPGHNGSGAVGVQSDDFTYDALLRVDGDFANDEVKIRYCEWLRDALNSASGRR